MMKITDSDYNEAPVFRILQKTRASFLICGGPSLRDIDPDYLNQRGIWSMAVNNAAGMHGLRPSAFVCADPPDKFHHGIWLDPCVMKFVPLPKLRKGRSVIRVKHKDGTFEKQTFSVCDCPNVWGFDRRNWLLPDRTFFEEGAAWGNLDAGVLRTGEPKTVCTMLLAIRLLYEMGSRRIYLLGADFHMAEGEGGYAFSQNRDADAIVSNNRQFETVNDWLVRLSDSGALKDAGLEIYNCSPTSRLQAFPYRRFSYAISDALLEFPREPFDLQGWYEK